MTSYSGSVTYLKYVANTTKSGITAGSTEFNSVLSLGQMSDDRVNYTSQIIVESAAAGQGTAQSFVWSPVLHNSITKPGDTTTKYDVKIVATGSSDIYGFYNEADKKLYSDAAYTTAIDVPANAKVTYKYNQEYIPANDIPSIGPKLVQIPLVAEPRRIAVKYDQITAFQA